MELSKFVLTETELSKIFLMETNGNGIPLNGIPFLFPFADRTNGISPCIKACGSMRQLTEMEI